MLINPRIAETPNAVFDPDKEWDALVGALRGNRIRHVHYHDVSGWNAKVRRLPVDLDCSYDVTLEDTIGPRGELGIRTDFQDVAFVRRARRLIVATTSQAGEVHRLLPESICLVRTCGTAWLAGRPRASTNTAESLQRILVLMDIQDADAVGQWVALLRGCVRDATRRRLPLHFFIGGGGDRGQFRASEVCTILEPFSPRRWDQYLARARPQVILPLSSSLAGADEMLSFCVRNAVMPVSFDENVVASRIRALQWGEVLSASRLAPRVNDALLRAKPIAQPPRSDLPDSVLLEHYAGTGDYYDGLAIQG